MLHCKYCDWHGKKNGIVIWKEEYGRVFECPVCGFYNDVDDAEMEG